jgi:hypothetical protein
MHEHERLSGRHAVAEAAASPTPLSFSSEIRDSPQPANRALANSQFVSGASDARYFARSFR